MEPGRVVRSTSFISERSMCVVQIESNSSRSISNYRVLCLGVCFIMTVIKLWLMEGQTLCAVGWASHDDRLFLNLALSLLKSDWLGQYSRLTLVKGCFYPIWIAFTFVSGIPLLFCAAFALYIGLLASDSSDIASVEVPGRSGARLSRSSFQSDGVWCITGLTRRYISCPYGPRNCWCVGDRFQMGSPSEIPAAMVNTAWLIVVRLSTYSRRRGLDYPYSFIVCRTSGLANMENHDAATTDPVLAMLHPTARHLWGGSINCIGNELVSLRHLYNSRIQVKGIPRCVWGAYTRETRALDGLRAGPQGDPPAYLFCKPRIRRIKTLFGRDYRQALGNARPQLGNRAGRQRRNKRWMVHVGAARCG